MEGKEKKKKGKREGQEQGKAKEKKKGKEGKGREGKKGTGKGKKGKVVDRPDKTNVLKMSVYILYPTKRFVAKRPRGNFFEKYFSKKLFRKKFFRKIFRPNVASTTVDAKVFFFEML